MLSNFPLTLPAELAAGQRRPLRQLGTSAYRTSLLHHLPAGPIQTTTLGPDHPA
jgi:hypothetical protein